MDRDLCFVSGSFFDCEIPKEKQYLLKYYTTPTQIAWLRYFITFGETICFCDHTGHQVSKRYLIVLHDRYRDLLAVEQKARTDMDLDMMWRLKSGGIKLVDM